MTGRIVACCGAFDGKIHPGHIHFLTEAKCCGERLYVCVIPDWVIQRNKNRSSIYAQDQRVKNITALNLADRVVTLLGDDENQLQQVVALKPDVFCFGEDQTRHFDIELAKRLKENGTQFMRILRYSPDLYSTTRQVAENPEH